MSFSTKLKKNHLNYGIPRKQSISTFQNFVNIYCLTVAPVNRWKAGNQFITGNLKGLLFQEKKRLKK